MTLVNLRLAERDARRKSPVPGGGEQRIGIALAQPIRALAAHPDRARCFGDAARATKDLEEADLTIDCPAVVTDTGSILVHRTAWITNGVL